MNRVESEVAIVFLSPGSATESRIRYAIVPENYVQLLVPGSWAPVATPNPSAEYGAALAYRPLTPEDYSLIANLGIADAVLVGCLVTSEMIEDMASNGVTRISLVCCDISAENRISKGIRTLSIKGCWFSHSLRFDRVSQVCFHLPTEFDVCSQAPASDLFLYGRKESRDELAFLNNVLIATRPNAVYLHNFRLGLDSLSQLLQSPFRSLSYYSCSVPRMAIVGPIGPNLEELDVSGLQGLSFDNIIQICKQAKALTYVSIGSFLLKESRLCQLYELEGIFFNCTSALMPSDMENPRGSVHRNVLF